MPDESTPKPPSPSAPSSGRKRNGRRRKVILSILAVVVVVGGVVGIPKFIYSLTHESTDDAFIDGHIVALSSRVAGHVLAVDVDDNQRVTAGQTLVRIDPAPFKAEHAKLVAALAAAQAHVKAATANLDLTEGTTKADVAGAEAGLSRAKAGVESARAAAQAAESALGEAQAEKKLASATVDQAAAELAAKAAVAELQKTDLGRVQAMFEKKSVPQQALDHAKTASRIADADRDAAKTKHAQAMAKLEAATAAVKAAKDGLGQARAALSEAQAAESVAAAALEAARTAPQKVGLAESDLESARAEVNKAKAELARNELDLSYTEIKCPVTGHVTHKTVEAGAYVEPGQGLMAIVPDKVWVVANFKETQLTDIRPGQPVTIEVDAWPDQVFTGKVQSIQHGTGARFSLLPPQNATGNYVKVVQRVPVKIVFDPMPDQAKYLLAPGMSVVPEVRVKGGE